MKTKELQENLIGAMKRWQWIEDAAVATTGQVMQQTANPTIRLVMEIIKKGMYPYA